MSETGFVIRKLEGSAAERQVRATAYREDVGEVTVTVPTSGVDADQLPNAIEHAIRVKLEAASAAEAD